MSQTSESAVCPVAVVMGEWCCTGGVALVPAVGTDQWRMTGALGRGEERGSGEGEERKEGIGS